MVKTEGVKTEGVKTEGGKSEGVKTEGAIREGGRRDYSKVQSLPCPGNFTQLLFVKFVTFR